MLADGQVTIVLTLVSHAVLTHIVEGARPVRQGEQSAVHTQLDSDKTLQITARIAKVRLPIRNATRMMNRRRAHSSAMAWTWIMLTLSSASRPLCCGASPAHDLCRITKKVISGVYQGVTTVELDVRLFFLPSGVRAYSSTARIEPGGRDGGVLDDQAPGLRDTRCPYRYRQPAQGDQEKLLAGHRGLVLVRSVDCRTLTDPL